MRTGSRQQRQRTDLSRSKVFARMGRQSVFCALGAVLFALCGPSEAQQARKTYRIAYITNRTDSGPNEEAFRRGLRELGYIEGENLAIEWRFTGA